MPSKNFPESVRQLIFDHIDSVELLEVLLFLRLHSGRRCTSDMISAELRSNPQSVSNRLNALADSGLVQREEGDFIYSSKNESLDNSVALLAELYKVRRHKILELIFSPLKKGRYFAEAFVVMPPKKDSDND